MQVNYPIGDSPKSNTPEYGEKLSITMDAVYNEVIRAKTMFPDNFHNQHEGYSVIHEETDELWDLIKMKQRHYVLEDQRKEAIQAAAMLLRFIVELT